MKAVALRYIITEGAIHDFYSSIDRRIKNSVIYNVPFYCFLIFFLFLVIVKSIDFT